MGLLALVILRCDCRNTASAPWHPITIPRGAILPGFSFQLLDATFQTTDSVSHGDDVTDMIEHLGQAKPEPVGAFVLERSQQGMPPALDDTKSQGLDPYGVWS